MGLTITRILHAGYIFTLGETRVVFDPVFENPFSGNCHAFPGVSFDTDAIGQLSFDAIFISHFHDDHCSLESLSLLNRETPLFLYCLFDELFEMLQILGFKRVQALQLDVPVHVGPLEIIPRRALESNVDAMFQVRAAGLNVLNVVDAAIDPATLRQLARQAPWDLVMWPFQIMREAEVIAPVQAMPATDTLPAEWLAQLQRLNPRVIIPSACQFQLEPWSWYNHAFFPISHANFRRQITQALPECQVVRLNPGQGIVLEKHGIRAAEALSWVTPVGDQDVDYRYDASLVPPPTAEIARRFPALPEGEAAQVWRYCSEGIVQAYGRLDPDDEGYFSVPRHWRLSVYDHTGSVREFHFHADARQLRPRAPDDGPLGWTTDVILQKLHAALFRGETLTSMYLRINDHVFDAETLAALADTEIADDPLIRCVFDGAFAHYQREQLRRLGLVNSGDKPVI